MSEGVFWEFIAHKYDLAIEAGRAALASEPNDAPLYSYLGLVYATQKRYAEAVELAQIARRMDDSPFIAAMVAYTYAAAGRRADAERMLSGISEEIKRTVLMLVRSRRPIHGSGGSWSGVPLAR